MTAKQRRGWTRAVVGGVRTPAQAAADRARTQEGIAKGLRNEQRALSAVVALMGSHAWIEGARRCTREEDARGVDLVVSTSEGDVALQVKSSGREAERFRRAHRYGPLVVVPTGDPERDMEIVLDAILRSRPL